MLAIPPRDFHLLPFAPLLIHVYNVLLFDFSCKKRIRQGFDGDEGIRLSEAARTVKMGRFLLHQAIFDIVSRWDEEPSFLRHRERIRSFPGVCLLAVLLLLLALNGREKPHCWISSTGPPLSYL